jgi:hypothetical protein
VNADDIAVAKTPPGGYGDEWPAPILTGCTEEIVAHGIDMRGTWRVVEATVDGVPVDDHRILGSVQRIEQCGDRVVMTS